MSTTETPAHEPSVRTTPAPASPGGTAPAGTARAGAAPAAASTTHETPTYEAAVARVEAIVRRLDSGEAGLRETLELVREGRGLVEYCAGELEEVSQGLEELALDDLVARLEDPAGMRR